MSLLPFGEYRPDLSDLDALYTSSVMNVVPRADGYGPFKSLEEVSKALGNPCRGLFCAHNRDNTVTIFAATKSRIYKMSNTDLSWTDVSEGATDYTDLPADGNWHFGQFNDYVIAVQANADPQVFNLTSSSAFADLGGNPPRASYIAIVNRFAVLSGLTDEPYRIQWCGLNEVDNWTSGANSSDYQDLPDGGIVRPVIGGEFGIILQDTSIRRMTFSPGSETIFDIQRIAKDTGCLAPYSACQAGDRAFFLSPKGFMMATGDGQLLPIGEEMINRTFLEDYDSSMVRLVVGVGDPGSNIVMWVYKSAGNSTETFDKGLVYNYVLQRWGPLTISGEYVATLANPGITMEGLAAVAPGAATISGAADNGSGLIRLTVSSTSGWSTGDYKTVDAVGGTTEANGTWAITVIDGTHIDLQGSTFANAYTSGGQVDGALDELTISLDAFSTSELPKLSACSSNHKVGFFSGDNLEATLETSEQSGSGRRVKVRGFYPITDASDVRGCVSKRETTNAALSYTSETTMSARRGFCSIIRDTRYTRAKIRIPSGTVWTFAKGIEPDFTIMGRT